MAVKSSIHIKPCNISSSEAHNLRTPEYMRNIGESKIYLIPQLVADNEYWINPRLGDYDLQTHYDNIKQMVKAKTGRAMQEKERERKTKSGKIVKVAGCSPIREGVLLIKPNTTLEDVRRFGEECQQRWGITPLQIFLHKDEGHWLGGEPAPDDKESFQIDGRWFKPNYHAHIVFDWMDHDTGKSRKLNDDDMMQMQTLASEILSMERGQSKTETGKEHLERNDFIIEKQRAELERIEAERQHKEHQIDLAEQELKQVKLEIRTDKRGFDTREQFSVYGVAVTDKLKSVATDAATALASGVSSLFGSGKMKSLERKNEDLRDEIAIRDETIEQLQSNIKQMQAEHQKQIQEVKQSYEAEHRKQSEYIDKILRYFPYVEKLMPMIKYLSEKMGFNDNLIKALCTFKEIPVKGKLYSTMFNQSFSADGAVCSLKEDKEGRFDLRIDGVSHHSWFRRKKDEFMEALGLPTSRRQNRGLKL